MAKPISKSTKVEMSRVTKKAQVRKVQKPGATIHKDILAYNAAQAAGDKPICETLFENTVPLRLQY